MNPTAAVPGDEAGPDDPTKDSNAAPASENDPTKASDDKALYDPNKLELLNKVNA